MTRRLHVLIFLSVVFSTPWTSAKEIAKVRFADAYRLGDTTLQLSNVGLMRYKGLIKAMAAGLYLPQNTSPLKALDPVPKRLEIEYFWSLKAEDIVKASQKILADNLDSDSLTRLQPQVDLIHRMYEDVKPGDRYALTYVPGRGTFLSLNGKLKGSIPGDAFAKAYFAIWLGDRPMDRSLKAQLTRLNS